MGKEIELWPLSEYERFIVAFSGGKDSCACVLHLLECGVSKEKIELWHHHVDGEESGLMDWPITAGYCKAFAQHLKLPLLFQWRDGGFEREMLRQEQQTGDVYYQTPDGELVHLSTTDRAPKGTRMKFPQVSANLAVRWCSAALKIDVCSRVIGNDPRLKHGKFLLVTGERRQESSARSKYLKVETHRTSGRARTMHQWRPVIDWLEGGVWEIFKRWEIRPHPAYELGFGRVSCLSCIFGNDDQWATVKDLAPETFAKIASYEEQFDCTIHRSRSVRERAAAGLSFAFDKSQSLRDLGMSTHYPVELIH